MFLKEDLPEAVGMGEMGEMWDRCWHELTQSLRFSPPLSLQQTTAFQRHCVPRRAPRAKSLQLQHPLRYPQR